MKYYMAYGSNLNKAQMAFRCPDAVPVGLAVLQNWELVFRRGVLTIEPKQGASVPIGIWEISDADEKSLDRYEGFPVFYDKKELRVALTGIRSGKSRTVTAFVYIMDETRPLGRPTDYYLRVCREGYEQFGFDPAILMRAVQRSTQP